MADQPRRTGRSLAGGSGGHEVRFRPFLRRVRVAPGTTVLDAAQAAGIGLQAVCGGEGTCNLCVVELDGAPAPTEERVALEGVGAGPRARLACRVPVERDLVVSVPPQSLTSSQRLHLEALETAIEPDLPDAVRALARPGTPLVGFAVDVGTTKLAGYLVDLETGKTLAAAGLMNPQITYGEDVVTRIAHATGSPGGAAALRRAVVGGINRLIERVCRTARVPASAIADVVAVGNTAMHHLLLDLPAGGLGRAPYLPSATGPMDLPAAGLGIHVADGVRLHALPNVAGWVGGDHVAMLLATENLARGGAVLCFDVGTNTEITLRTPDGWLSCSAASGPVFEGAHIRDGMRASRGAIERVRIEPDGRVEYQTVAGRPPIGLCGSGVLDAVAHLRQRGLLSATGALLDGTGVRRGAGGLEFVIARAGSDGRRREVVLTAADIAQVQLAKAAIRAGAEVLLGEAGLDTSAVERVILAGTFGTYLDPASAVAIGMFPPVALGRFQQVGNAAGAGARAALVSVRARRAAVELASSIRYVELMSHPRFHDAFTEGLLLP